MDANLDNIAQDLYGKLETRFPNLKIGDEHAEVLSKEEDIPKARFFEFEYTEDGRALGTITITLDSDDGIIVQISGDLIDDRDDTTQHLAYKFIRSLRKFAKNRLLKFDVQNIGKSNLDKRDYNFKAKRKEEPMDPMMESKLYGNARVSYQDLGEARLVVKHSQPVNPELAAGRTMHIESIYIENAVGERFKYPYKHLNGARALAEHIKHGGTPYDNIGKHICSLSEELAHLRKFKGYVSRQEQLSEAMAGVTNRVIDRIETIKETISKLQRPAYYEEFAEAFQEAEEILIPEEVQNDLIDRLTIRTFNEELKSVFPYIYKFIDESELPVIELSADDLLGEEEDTNTTVEASSTRVKEEDELEEFFDQFVSEEPSTGILSPDKKAQQDAVEELNHIFTAELTGGHLNIVNTLKDLIPIPEFLDSFENIDDELDARSAIESALEKLATHNPQLAEVLPRIDFSGGEGEIGGDNKEEEPAPAAPPAPAAAPAPAAPAPAPAAAPVAEESDDEDPPFDPDPKPHKHSTPGKGPHGQGMADARHASHKGLMMAIKRAKDAGAKLDTRLNIGGREMTLHDAIDECGMTPMEVGFENNGSDMESMKKFLSGFFNREKRNFTLGGERVKIKLQKEFPDANPHDLNTMFSFIDKLDPPSEVKQHHDILKLAGVNKDVDECGLEMPDFESLMQGGVPEVAPTISESDAFKALLNKLNGK